MKTKYTHQVNYSKRFTSGILAGRLYHDHLRFCSLEDAKAFAAREGETIRYYGYSGSYAIEDTMVIDLADFL